MMPKVSAQEVRDIEAWLRKYADNCTSPFEARDDILALDDELYPLLRKELLTMAEEGYGFKPIRPIVKRLSVTEFKEACEPVLDKLCGKWVSQQRQRSVSSQDMSRLKLGITNALETVDDPFLHQALEFLNEGPARRITLDAVGVKVGIAHRRHPDNADIKALNELCQKLNPDRETWHLR